METIVDEPTWLRAGSWIGCPLVGAGVGYGLWAIAAWASSLSAFPFQGFFTALTSIQQPWSTLLAVAVGVLLGLGFALLWAADRLIVTVAAHRVTLVRGDKTRRIEADLESVFLDGKELVMVTADGRELVREKTDLEKPRLARAFTEHGLPWHDEPPAEK